jgi:hypothetical protein
MKLRIHTDFPQYVTIQVRCEGSKLVQELNPWSPRKITAQVLNQTTNQIRLGESHDGTVQRLFRPTREIRARSSGRSVTDTTLTSNGLAILSS